jgi:hypothetical protein
LMLTPNGIEPRNEVTDAAINLVLSAALSSWKAMAAGALLRSFPMETWV